MPRTLLWIALFLLLLADVTNAQLPRPPEFASPVVREDRTLVFKLFAPQASSVRLASGDLPGGNPFGPGTELKKNDDGIWEAKVGPLPAGTYRYHFLVDGFLVVDPRNPSTSEANANTFSLVSVPGSEVSDRKEVPHGAVAHWTYFSKSLNVHRRVHVYTPPGYEAGTDVLPVLYLLHGATDCDASWSTVGRAGFILDNLIAAGKAKPMIVVMPMGHTGPFSFGPGGNLGQQMADFAKDFAQDLKPLVERRYRVSSERKHRAIAGLSMGGAQTLDIAMSSLGEYGYIGVFSSGVFGINGTGPGGRSDGPTWQERHKDTLDDPKLKEGLKLVWFATGKEDFLLKTSQETVKELKAYHFDVTYLETEGGHTWVNWREHYLPQFAQLLFQ